MHTKRIIPCLDVKNGRVAVSYTHLDVYKRQLIQGYAEGLKDNVIEDDESKEFYCDVILDEAGKMNKLVRQLLDLNELEFGVDRVHPVVFDIDALIKNVVDSSSILVEQNHAEVELADELNDVCNVYACLLYTSRCV